MTVATGDGDEVVRIAAIHRQMMTLYTGAGDTGTSTNYTDFFAYLKITNYDDPTTRLKSTADLILQLTLNFRYNDFSSPIFVADILTSFSFGEYSVMEIISPSDRAVNGRKRYKLCSCG